MALVMVVKMVTVRCRLSLTDGGKYEPRDAFHPAHHDLGAQVVHEPRRGFGAACHAGLLAASAELICFMDADASLDPAQLPRVASAVLDGSSDLVLGRRVPQTAGAWPPHARLGNAVLARTLRRRTSAPLHDLGPMRAARRSSLLALGLTTAASATPWRRCSGPPQPAGGSPR